MRRYTQTIRFSMRQSRRRSNQFAVYARNPQPTPAEYSLPCPDDCSGKEVGGCTRCNVYLQPRVVFRGQEKTGG